MKKIFLSSLILLLAASCSKENELQDLNSLIILDNVYEQAFISCTLKPNSSLINFDRFVDVFIAIDVVFDELVEFVVISIEPIGQDFVDLLHIIAFDANHVLLKLEGIQTKNKQFTSI